MAGERPATSNASFRSRCMYIAATPNPRAAQIRGAGEPSSRGESRGESTGGAGSFSASPTANPAGRRERLCGYRYLLFISCHRLPRLRARAFASIAGPGLGRPNGRFPRRRQLRRRRHGARPRAPQHPSHHPVVQGCTAKIKNGLAYAPSDAPSGRSRRRSGPATRSGTKPYMLRRRPRPVERRRLRLLGHRLLRAPRRRPDQRVDGLRRDGELGQQRRGPVGHDLHKRRPRVHRDRRHPPRHLRIQDPNPAPGSGPRWRPDVTSWSGFMRRHPTGL